MVKPRRKQSDLETNRSRRATGLRPFVWMQRLQQYRRQWVSAWVSAPSSNPSSHSPGPANLSSQPASSGSGQPGKRSPAPNSLPHQPPRSSWRWTLICLAALGVISGMGTAALLWLVKLPPPPECKTTVRPTLDMELLYCTQQTIQAGGLPELIAGLNLLKQWPVDDPLYAETEKLAEEWSKQVLAIARRKVNDSDLEGGLAAVSHIPATAPVYEEAQAFVAHWKQQWQEGAAIEAEAQAALKQQNWPLVSELIAALAKLSNPYWHTNRANALAQQLGVEKQGRQILARARTAAADGRPARLGEALGIAQKIAPDTHTWQAARQDVRAWSQTLLAIGLQRWEAGDHAESVAALKAAPRSTTLPELQDLLRFSHAYQLLFQSLPGQQSAHWIPSWTQVWGLLEAHAAMQQVATESPFYAQAQAAQQQIQAQLEDITQIYSAAVVAKLGQPSTLELAIAQAQQVGSDRPQRLQAQTLIAYWQDEIERTADRPYLDAAIALAEPGDIADLQAAIAAASQIAQGRALRAQAQGQIAAWQRQIETIEDQPTLDRAWSLANQGQLTQAIATAEAIQPARALFTSAQSAIDTWQTQQIQAAQLAADQPLLNQAQSLADRGDLDGAIRTAAQIGFGRVLSGEAQGLIANWEAQLRPPQPDESAASDLEQESDLQEDLLNPTPDTAQEWIHTLPPGRSSLSPVPTPLSPTVPLPTAGSEPLTPSEISPEVVAPALDAPIDSLPPVLSPAPTSTIFDGSNQPPDTPSRE
jgi:ribosome-binding factor A